MRFLVDSSTDAGVARHLLGLAHDVTRVGRDYPGDLEDRLILDIAVYESRILVTDDSDFGELVSVHRRPHRGVIYFRLVKTPLPERLARLVAVLASHADRLDRFLVIRRNSVKELVE